MDREQTAEQPVQTGMGGMTEEQIFAEAIKFSGEERARFIEQACGPDERKREHLLKMIAAHE